MTNKLTETLRQDWVRWGAALLLVVLGGFHYQGMFRLVIWSFSSPREDMEHGWLVPLVCLGALWWKRNEFRNAAGEPSWRGFGWVCLFLVMAWFGARGSQLHTEQFSFIGLLWAVPYALWGKRIGRLMLFPAWFLLFTIPVTNYLGAITVPLRLLASWLAVAVLNGLGAEITRSGTAVTGNGFNVDIADPCSGIRSLYAMMALTFGYAYFNLKGRLLQGMLFVCAIPIAVLGNMIRIFSICLVALWFGQKIALGPWHDYSGYMIFAVGLGLMFATLPLIKKLDTWLQRKKILPHWLFEKSEAPETLPVNPQPPVSPVKKEILLVAGLICVLATLTFQSRHFFGDPTHEPADFIASDLPHDITGFTSDRPWFCSNEKCNHMDEERILIAKQLQQDDGFKCQFCGSTLQKIAAGEKKKLPVDTEILKRNYHAPDGRTYIISVVISGTSRRSIHRAELCLPAQGYQIQSTGSHPLNVPGGRPRQARIIQAQHSLTPIPFTLAYWFVSRNWECTSSAKRIYIDVWDRSIHNRINRWAMVAVNISPPLDNPENQEAFEAFLGEFYPQILLQHQAED